MKQREHVALQHRGLPDDPDDNEFVDGGSVRGDARSTVQGSVIVGHQTRESFMRAVSRNHVRAGRELHDPAPIQKGYSAAEARAGLRAIYCSPQPPREPAPDLRAEGRGRMERNRERQMV